MVSRFGRGLSALALASLLAQPLSARAGEPLTIEQIVARSPVSGTPPSGFGWAPDGSRYDSLPGAREKDPPVLHVHDQRTGAERVLFAARSTARGSRSREIGQLVWSPDGTRLAYVRANDLYVVALAGGRVTRVTTGATR